MTRLIQHCETRTLSVSYQGAEEILYHTPLLLPTSYPVPLHFHTSTYREEITLCNLDYNNNKWSISRKSREGGTEQRELLTRSGIGKSEVHSFWEHHGMNRTTWRAQQPPAVSKSCLHTVRPCEGPINMSLFNIVALLLSRQWLGESSQPRCKSTQTPNPALIPDWEKECCTSPGLLSLHVFKTRPKPWKKWQASAV